MKKLLLIAAVAAMGVQLHAQETRFGVKAGFGLSTIKIDDKQDDLNERKMDAKATFYVGGLVEHKFSDRFGIQGELLYSPLGAKEDVEGSEGGYFFSENTKITFGTLLIPVSAKYFITENLSVAGGLNFGIILSAKQKTVLGTNLPIDIEVETGEGEIDIKDDVKTLNLAPFVGVEYALENGLFFDARYNLGVSNLSNDGSGGKVTNSFAQVGVGFKFGSN